MMFPVSLARGRSSAPMQMYQRVWLQLALCSLLLALLAGGAPQLRTAKTANVHLSVVPPAASRVPQRMLHGLKAARNSSDAIPTENSVTVQVVEVPVMVVVETEQVPPPDAFAPQLASECQHAMTQAAQNSTLFKTAQVCEQKHGYSEKARKALTGGDLVQAEAHVENSFHVCVGVEKGCAKQVAADVVLKMRLMGIAVSDSCKQKAQSTMAQNTDKSRTCQSEKNEAMLQSLQNKDMASAMKVAEDNLVTCQKVEAKCAFQLAPILVMQAYATEMQSAQQQMATVLVNGLREAEEMSDKVALGEFSPVVKGETRVKAKGKWAATAKQHKQVSLLNINAHMRITAREHKF